jgi:hypothetical protein
MPGTKFSRKQIVPQIPKVYMTPGNEVLNVDVNSEGVTSENHGLLMFHLNVQP